MGHGQMLRVSKVEDWLHRAPTRPNLSTHGDCVVIRSSHSYDGKQGVSLASGVSSQTAGAQALCLHVVMIPPGTPHLPVNRSDVMTIAVVARTDPQEQESVVVLELPRHLADLLSLPVAVQE